MAAGDREPPQRETAVQVIAADQEQDRAGEQHADDVRR